MSKAPWACSECGSRYWPDPDSNCESCQPSRQRDPEYDPLPPDPCNEDYEPEQ
jgi:hypothetical protein